MPQDEAASIALHFVIAEYNMGMSDTVNATTMIRECISIVEKESRALYGAGSRG